MRAARYVGFLQNHTRAILAGSLLAVIASAYLVAVHLPLHADFAYLLPADAPSVKAMEAMAARMPARDTTLLLITAPDPATRAAAGAEAVAGLGSIDRSLIERIETDDDATRTMVRAHRHLFASLADLIAVRDALAARITAAKDKANPLLLDLDDAPAPRDALDDLRVKRKEAEARLDRADHVSADGTVQVIVIRTAFVASNVELDHQLEAKLDTLIARIETAYPGAELGLAGGVPTNAAEHRALVQGVLLSSLITAVLVALVLLVHLRSVRVLVLLTTNIAAATLVSFGVAAFTVGHLNAATAFLGAIIAGNGVNYGILLVARYGEERRKWAARDAMVIAIQGTLKPTLVASLGAAIAYGALGATRFRGFADFALIGGIGMLVCWIATFVLLPVLVLRWAHTPKREPSRMFGRFVVRAFGFRSPVVACTVAGAAVLVTGVIAWRYLATDPFEYDMTQMRSQASDAVEARRWMTVSDAAFGRGLAGIAGQTFVAVDHPSQVPALVASLRAAGEREPVIGPVGSILDVIPADQPAKLAVLSEIRTQIDDVAPELSEVDRADLLALRPPDDLGALRPKDLPPALAARLTERDGTIGAIVAIKPGPAFSDHDGRALIRFAAAIRAAAPADATIAGPAVLFADVFTQIRRDGPIVVIVASLGILLMVLLVVGPNRRSAAVLVATAAGSVAMIAACAVAGIKITFLDFVALPIALGLGIDYAINVADRATTDDPRVALQSTGGTVLVCSLTTIIGYASLLVSDNLAIRGFGLASLIGEVTCVAAALVIVPAILALPYVTSPSPSRRSLPASPSSCHS
ncbi:MAG: MMPL family transporter [Deltaproteobacteria bacterium]|nr:MMPL family transporter [Deltaproteobacteria bacterium]